MNTQTPMMQQYLEIKARYPDALLLYRMGDFYELFMEDAVIASKVLEIALTSRDKQAENPIPMCGVPYHAAENYLSRLIDAGYKVAVCDQVEDPRKAKGLVRREVTRVITPGLVLDSRNLETDRPNYLAAVASRADGRFHGLSYLDIPRPISGPSRSSRKKYFWKSFCAYPPGNCSSRTVHNRCG